MLTLIWQTSCILAALSLIVMLVLIVRRLLISRSETHSKIMRAKLRQELIRFTANHDEDSLREVLARTPNADAIDVAVSFLELLRGDNRRDIIRALAAANLPAAIRKQLQKGDEVQKLAATELLVAFPYVETRAELNMAMGRASHEVRISSAIALAKIGALPHLPEVLDKIGSHGQQSRRLVDLFRSVSAERSAEILAIAKDKTRPDFIRAAAIDALGHKGTFQYLAEFEAMAQDTRNDVTAAAIRALGLIGHPRSAGAIRTALGHPDWQVRLEAAEATGRIGDTQALTLLPALLSDDEWATRYMAAKSMIALGKTGVDALMGEAAAIPSRAQRTAALALAEKGLTGVQ